MNNTKINWILLVLFCVLTVIFCICLIMTPATGDPMNTLGRVGLWLGVIADVVNAVVQIFEIRRKKQESTP